MEKARAMSTRSRPLEELAAQAEEIELPGGRRLQLRREPEQAAIELVDGQGRTLLTLLVGREAPVLRLVGEGLTLRVPGCLALDADRLELRGRDELAIRSGGDLSIGAEGEIASRALHQRLVADPGEVELRANDDVRIDGERIRMKC